MRNSGKYCVALRYFLPAVLLAISLAPPPGRVAAQEGAQQPAKDDEQFTAKDHQGKSESRERDSQKPCGAKIVGGCESLRGSWGSFALVHPAQNTDWIYCGGSVIDPQWVLTAAHCVTQYGKVAKVAQPTSLKLTDIAPDSLVVREGVWRLDGSDAGHKGRLVQVAQILHNENYRVTMLPNGDTVFTNDIALLRLAKPVEAPRQALARRADVAWFTKPGTVSTVVGFGNTTQGGQSSLRMAQVDVPIITEERCKTGYPMMDYAARICAGFDVGGKDSCQGDSGGPLFVRDALKQPIQVGIVSYGHGCAEAKAWGVYSSVGAFEDWIKQRVPNAVFSDQGAESGTGGSAVVMAGLQNFVAHQPAVRPSQLAQVTVDVTPGRAIKIGEVLKVRVTSSVDGRLVVFNRDEAGRTTQIFPNSFTRTAAGGHSREEILAGETIEIPGGGDKFALRATPPAGINEIIALIAPPDAKISDLTQHGKDMKTLADPEAILNAIDERSEDAEGSRGLAVEEARSAGRAVGQRKYKIIE